MADKYLAALTESLPDKSTTTSWAQTQGSLFRAVEMEKTMMTLLLMIIVLIAAFNIVSIVTMMVADKRTDIAVLRTMGASPAAILKVFMIQGMAVGLSGIAIGIAIGIPMAIYTGDIVSWFESSLGMQVFNPDVYFLSRIPSELEWRDIALIALSGLVLSTLATIYPSIRASKVQPAEALRYE